MTQAMPWVFAGLATLALGAAVVAFWQSVRAVLGLADVEDARGEGTSAREAELFARKRALLEGLRELDFDHEAGKLSDEDHREERERLRVVTKDVMRAIDAAIGPHRPAALALVEAAEKAALAEAGGAVPAVPAAPEPEPPPASEEQPPAQQVFADRRSCPNCATENEVDATFCKRCATRLATEALV